MTQYIAKPNMNTDTGMKTFNIDTEKTERAVDILTAGQNNSAQNILSIGAGIGGLEVIINDIFENENFTLRSFKVFSGNSKLSIKISKPTKDSVFISTCFKILGCISPKYAAT